MVSGNKKPVKVKKAAKTDPTADFSRLSEAEQKVVAERLLKIEESGWKPFWCSRPNCDGMPHEDLSSGVDGAVDPKWAHNHARKDQRLPSWVKPWTLFIMSGRGTGKTRTGVEFVALCARKGLDGAIIGRRGTELINTHVAALIEHAHPEFKPEYHASKDILVWPNGAKTYLFSAERPENIRSVNLSYFWMDEAAFMPEVETAWMNAKMATRVKKNGNPIHILVTSTPTSTPWVMKMEDDEDVEIRRVSTYANRANLDPDFLAALEKEYEGTRMGRQELHGEVLRDVEGALWNDEMFQHRRVSAEEYERLVDSHDNRVLAVDPAGSKGPRSDATGIIGVGTHIGDSTQTFDVLLDATIKGGPTEWAAQVFKAARLMRAHKIVAEKNFGGDMVKQVLADYAELNPTTTCDENGEPFKIDVVHASQSKETRAEATVGKYEQARVTHVTSPVKFGDLSELEKEQVHWVPKSRGGRSPSPNRIDALVWAVRELEKQVRFAATSASGTTAVKALKNRVSGNVPRQGRVMGGTSGRVPRMG